MEDLQGQADLGSAQPEGQEPKAELSVDVLKDELKKVRREAAEYRTKLRAVEEAQGKAQQDKMTEVERLQADLEKTQAQLEQTERLSRERLVRSAVAIAAARAGFNDPDDAYRLLDMTALEVVDDGTVDGLDKAIQAIVKAKPYLLKTKSAIMPTNPSGGAVKPSDEQLRAELFGGGRRGSFWNGGGVVTPSE